MSDRKELPVFALALVALVGIIVLSALHIEVTNLWTVLYVLLAGGLGLTVPSGSSPTSTTSPASGAAAPAPAPTTSVPPAHMVSTQGGNPLA